MLQKYDQSSKLLSDNSRLKVLKISEWASAKVDASVSVSVKCISGLCVNRLVTQKEEDVPLGLISTLLRLEAEVRTVLVPGNQLPIDL